MKTLILAAFVAIPVAVVSQTNSPDENRARERPAVAIAAQPPAVPPPAAQETPPAPSPRVKPRGVLQPGSPFTDDIDVTVSNLGSPLAGITNGDTIRATRIPGSSTWYGRRGDIIVQIVRNEGAGSPLPLIHFSLGQGQTTLPVWGSHRNNWDVSGGLPVSGTITTGTIDPMDVTRRNLLTYTATLTPVP